MGKIIVKRFLDDRLGMGASAIARWANKHDARVISQSVSHGWIVVSFEVADKESLETTGGFGVEETRRGSLVSVREASDAELLEMVRSDRRRKSRPSKITISYNEDVAEADAVKIEKKRWWKR